MESPLISVITPLFNAEKFIAETISSVQSQTHANWEMLVVDDASTDASAAIVHQLSLEDSRIKLYQLSENQGAAFCRNEATRQAQGAYITFLDSDDLWHSEKLERQLRFMKDNNCTVSYTNYLHIDEQGELLYTRIRALPQLSFDKLKRNNYVGNLTGMYHAKSLGKIMAPKIRKRQDWALWLEAIRSSKTFALGLEEDLAYYRVREGSISSNKWKLIPYNFQIYRNFLGYSWMRSCFWLMIFMWEYFVVRPKQIEHYK